MAALAAIVLANLSAVSQAFSPSVEARTAARTGQVGLRSSLRSSGFTVRAGRPGAWRHQHQKHEAARSTTSCTCLGGGTSTSSSSTSSRRLSTRRTAASTNTVMMGSSNANTAKDQQQQQQQQLQLLPGTVVLQPGDPIEFWHAQGLVLGNYESPVPGRQSLVVRTETGEQLNIDAGQIVGVWRENEMSGRLPTSSQGSGDGSGGAVAAWAEIREEVRTLLQSTPARGLDLGPFWRAASSKGKGLVATPAHAAEFLFGAGSPAKLGLRKRPPFQFRR